MGLKCVSSIRRFLIDDSVKDLLLPISSHSLTTATVSSWVHLIMSSNLSRKFQTLLQDLFSWHPTTTKHLSRKNCTGFPFQNILKVTCVYFIAINGSGPAYFSELLHVYTLSHTLLFFRHPHAENPEIHTQDSWLSHLLLLWTPRLQFTPTRH